MIPSGGLGDLKIKYLDTAGIRTLDVAALSIGTILTAMYRL